MTFYDCITGIEVTGQEIETRLTNLMLHVEEVSKHVGRMRELVNQRDQDGKLKYTEVSARAVDQWCDALSEAIHQVHNAYSVFPKSNRAECDYVRAGMVK